MTKSLRSLGLQAGYLTTIEREIRCCYLSLAIRIYTGFILVWKESEGQKSDSKRTRDKGEGE